MAQFARPNGTVTTGSWSAQGGPSTLWEAIDETTFNDADFIRSTGAASACEVTLGTVVTPTVRTGHVFRFRMRSAGGQGGENVNCDLYQGTTLIKSSGNQSNRSSSFAAVSISLTEAEANAITDYSNLRFRFTASHASSETVDVSWAELEVPDGNAPPSILSSSANDSGRDYDNRTQEILIEFTEAVQIVPAPNVGDTIAGLQLLLEFTWFIPCTYISGNGTTSWVVKVNPFPDPGFEITNGSFIDWDYDAATGNITAVSDGTEIPDDLTNITNNLTKRLRVQLKDKNNVALNAVTVQYAVFDYESGNPANANWMLREQKGTGTTDANGLLDVQFTGDSIPGGLAYVAILHPSASPTESLIWTTEIR